MGKLFVVLAVIFILVICIFIVCYVLSKDYKCKKYGHDIHWSPFVALNNDNRVGKCRRCGKTIIADMHGNILRVKV